MKRFLLIIFLYFSFVAYAKAIVTNSVEPVTYFVDHIEQLKIIANNLKKYNQTSLVGISGMGKTQLARTYVHENKDNYDLIWFIDCNLDIDEQFLALAKYINKNAKEILIAENSPTVKKSILDFLSNKDKWLLVFDNLKIKGNIQVLEFIKWEHNGHLIFCSQETESLPNVIKMNTLNKEDVVLLSEKLLDINETKFSQFLNDEFKGYPILTVQATQLLKTIKGLSMEEYKKKLHETSDQIESNLKLALSKLSSSAKNLLFRVSLINNQKFSKELLKMITDTKDTIDDDIYQLSKFVLISCVNNDETNPIFEMHDVIASSVKKLHGDTNNQFELENIITKFLGSIPEGVYKAHIFRNATTMQENLEIILQNAQIYNSNISKVMELKLHLLGSYCNASDFYNAEKLVKWFEEKDVKGEFNSSLINNHEQAIYAGYLSTVGTYNRKRLADHNEALKYYNRAAVIFDQVSGRENWKFNLSYLSALSNISIGKISDAEKNIQKLEAAALTGKVDKGDLGLLHRIKAKLNYYQGNYPEALINIDKGISESISNGVKIDDAVLTAPYVFKAAILNSLGKYQEAYNQSQDLYNMHKSKSENHLVFGRIYTQMARAELGLKKVNEALEHTTIAEKILLGDEIRNNKTANFSEDEDLAECYVVQADALFESDKLKEAIDSYRKAQGIYFHLFQDRSKNVDFLSHLYVQGAMASCKNKDLYHYKCFGEAQIKDFGIEHRNSITMIKYCENKDMDLWVQED